MDKLNILITGSESFVGKHLVKSLLKSDYVNKIVGTSLYPTIHTNNKKFIEYVVDITCENFVQELMKKEQPNVVIHLAAISNPGDAEKNSTELLKVNVLGTHNIAKYTPKGCKFIFASSIVVYGDYKGTPWKEGDIEKPTSLYGASKLASEKILEVLANQRKIQLINLRFCAIVGSNLTHGVIYDFMKKIKSKDKEFEILGNYPGSIKPYILLQDACNAIKLTILSKLSHQILTLNITNEDGISIDTIANLILIKSSIQKKKIWLGKNFAGDNNIICANNDLAKNILKWSPTLDNIHTIKQILDNYDY